MTKKYELTIMDMRMPVTETIEVKDKKELKGANKMTKFLENIIEFYIEEIQEEHRITRAEAEELLEMVLQDYDIETEIKEKVCTVR